jgi:Protein of unknown function (DUF4236)
VGLIYRKRERLTPAAWLNLSKSGVSVSKRVGRVTFNTRGRARVRIAPRTLMAIQALIACTTSLRASVRHFGRRDITLRQGMPVSGASSTPLALAMNAPAREARSDSGVCGTAPKSDRRPS